MYRKIFYVHEMKYILLPSLLYKNSISGKNSATHIIIYAVISCNEVHKTKDCFCSTKVFSSAIFTSCVYYSIQAIRNKLEKVLLFIARQGAIYGKQLKTCDYIQHQIQPTNNFNPTLNPFLYVYKRFGYYLYAIQFR